MSGLGDKLIVALDVGSLEEARRFVGILYPTVKFFKIGSQLFTACGPAVVEMIGRRGARVFLDLKFYDIPKTVYLVSGTGTSCAFTYVAASQGVKNLASPPVFMMSVHIKGGIDMLREAVKGASEKATELNIKKPFIVGVTKLTSEEATLKEVLDAARIAKEAGLDGVVCSALEAKKIREEFGVNFIIVTPGIRPKGSSADDQKRTTTAKEAIEAGSDFIVVGRTILKAVDPLKAAQEMIAESTN